MPFTISHIAFALPLKKVFPNSLSISGLIAGSMLPDAEYYLRMTMYGTWGHSLKGVLIYELFLGLICLFVYHSLIKQPLLDNLPNYLKVKYMDSYNLRWVTYFKSNWIKVICSVYIGIATHLFWDILTHEQGYIFGVSLTWLESIHSGIPLHSWLQITLSIIGLVATGIVVFTRDGLSVKSDPKSTLSKMKFWAVVLVLFLVSYAIRFWIGIPNEKYWIQHIVISVSAGIIALLVASIYYSITNSRVAA